MEASRVLHGFVYRFAAGAYAFRGGDELVGLSHGNGNQFLQGAEDVPEPMGKRDAEVFVFEVHRDEFLDAAQREVDLSSV
jgi:hypothetical protein